jgi:hypothetical protein
MAAPNGVHQAGGRGGAAAALYAAGRPPVGGLSPLSESLWKARAESTSIAVPSPHDFSARLTWIDLWVTVTGKGSKQAILQGLTGYAEPGEIMAIMGPSGSGKSTLLDTLAGRLAKTASQTGEVLLNGRRKTNLSYGIAVNVFSHKIISIHESFLNNKFIKTHLKCHPRHHQNTSPMPSQTSSVLGYGL